MADEEEVREEDPRFAYVLDFLTETHKIEFDKWIRLKSNEEYVNLLRNFMDSPSEIILSLQLSATGFLIPQTFFKPILKAKIFYILKQYPIYINDKNFKEMLLLGAIIPKSINDIAKIIEENFLPLLIKPDDQKDWPQVIIEDVKRHTYDIKSYICQLRSLSIGETILPMPMGTEEIFGDGPISLQLISRIEHIVVDWRALIREILDQDSAQLFQEINHPLPKDEIQFWKNRLKNIESIYDQLRDPRVKRMVLLLQKSDSTYLRNFQDTFKDVVAAIIGIRDICLYLTPLEKYFNEIESQSDFILIKSKIKPMMHCICLTWAKSKYYCNSIRIVTLFKEITNLLIEKVVDYVDPGSLFQGEPEDSLKKIQITESTIEYYIEAVETFRKRVPKYFRGRDAVPWSFHDKLILERIIKILKRIKFLKDILVLAVDYVKLEKVEIAGLRGKKLQNTLTVVFEEFMKSYNDFSNVNYEILSPEDPSFDEEVIVYFKKVDQFDRRLAAIFNQVFSECHTIEGICKMSINIGSIALRPEILKQLWPYYEKMLYLLDKELEGTKTVFDENINMFREDNFDQGDSFVPPISAVLSAIRKQKTRINKSMENIKAIEHPLTNSEYALYLFGKAKELKELLNAAEAEVFNDWTSSVPEIILQGLQKVLFRQSEDGTLYQNLDKKLEDVLQESKYMILTLERKDLPAEAIDVFSRITFFYECKMRLDHIAFCYNSIYKITSDVEKTLIEDEMNEINELIDLGKTYNWNSPEVVDYVENLYRMIDKLHKRIIRAQSNLANNFEKMTEWSRIPVIQRKVSKTGQRTGLLLYNIKQTIFEERYSQIKNDSNILYSVLNENYKLYFNLMPEVSSSKDGEELKDIAVQVGLDEDEDQISVTKTNYESEESDTSDVEMKSESELTKVPSMTPSEIHRNEKEELLEKEAEAEHQKKFAAYLAEVDTVISKIIVEAGKISIQYIFDESNPENMVKPLFEIELLLEEPDILFQPSAELEDPNGFYSLYENIMLDIMKMGTIITRIDPNLLSYREHYTIDMAENSSIISMLEDLSDRVRRALDKAKSYSQDFLKYSWLWLDNRAEYLKTFLEYSRILTNEEKYAISTLPEDELPENLKKSEPSLNDFEREINQFINIYDECEQIETKKLFFKWFMVLVEPLKQKLLNTICKWSNMFKQHLINRVDKNLKDTNNFFLGAIGRFSKPLEENDYYALLDTISFLKQIRDRASEIDSMFKPLKETIQVLKKYDVEFPEDTIILLNELPERWEVVQKSAARIKQVVDPLHLRNSALHKKRFDWFNYRQRKLLEDFRNDQVFEPDTEEIYDKLDDINNIIKEFDEELAKLIETANIFEMPIPEFPELEMIHKEIKMLKKLWDYVNIIESSLDAWKSTVWLKIDVDGMDAECKNYMKELRVLDKEIKSWKLYSYIESQVRNMMSSLRSVLELQNPAIKDRHWHQLMAETKVKFTMDAKTTLDDLLRLQLHRFEEEVKNIVDKAVKEAAMEKVLNELSNTWSTLEFEKQLHERTKLNILRITEEITDLLEDHQVQLQNMLCSKFIGYFRAKVEDWQAKLGNADAVTGMWMEVQKTWMYLESIFIGSEDIRSQLPEDTRRFEKIDREFKELLRDAITNLNVVKATNKPRLFEKLEEIKKELTICEKALADYLDLKRLAYPRFYFISPADLLDILSNGNNPQMVCKHLAKLYDSIANLQWKLQSDGKPTKIATALVAKDGELMKIHGTLDCGGKVESWLNHVTIAMKRTVRYHFNQAVYAYEDKPRDLWLFDYNAQPALCGTQIWWTTEVNEAFAQLEEGFDNALKDYQKKQIAQLYALISLLIGELTDQDRQKIMTICTIDVHARDVVAKLIQMKAETVMDFQWQSQLRHRWDDEQGDCFANICDACFLYTYEYLGNTPRLVITPLTDRCYITLTQSLHLVMGSAPAGPAGTGKTETTKDLGRALGQMVYVFNCSEQMDYKSCANIYKGLGQTGAWGCFDEFNRISVEVLSVVAVQVKSVLDGIKSRRPTFHFFGEDLNLIPSVGMFITMNPGYAGRTELPENLKALFRPCAMVVPDFELICEIMLVAEGFQEARLLARKFITLYTLCRELLSKQDHYDWGLRAIKSVLVVAGKLKRGDRDRPEDQVLMRALRDFNVPKIVTDDMPVFMGLIGDLFPALNVPRKRDLDFEADAREATLDLKLQPEEGFILKLAQLEELLFVRHSVFIVGFAGTGKSQVWKTLFKTYQNQGTKPYFDDLDPKAVTNDELFGIINPATREWKDGLVSILMRDQANMGGQGAKWLIFDGDIDPMWIESLNTVMDDNKVLTLASNERIALTKQMRLIFEISNLRTATPATVSRAGILYINPQDLGWSPFVASWIYTRPKNQHGILNVLFDKYIPLLLDAMKLKFKKITPIPDIAHLEMLCNLLDCFLTPENVPSDSPIEWYELYFTFCAIWGFGSSLFQDQLIDWRKEFSKWWLATFTKTKIPLPPSIFDFYIDPETKALMPWDTMVGKFTLDPDLPLQATLVPTSETIRIRFFMDILMNKKVPVMLIGFAGSGKSVMVADKLASLPLDYSIANIPLNFYTTSEMIQRLLEKYLEKKAGRTFAPPGNKNLVYFIDDLNMPEVDSYGTVQSHTIIRQHMDYEHWYDRVKFTLKDIRNTQYVSCMNPTAGSFTIDPRLQRHFASFAVSFPSRGALERIYTQILEQHLSYPGNKINPGYLKVTQQIMSTVLYLHEKVATSFLPTAIKFHYVFNLRELSNIFQGILFATGDTIPTLPSLMQLLVHEATRVYCDKLIDKADKNQFENMVRDVSLKFVQGVDEAAVFVEPLIFCHFAEGIGDPKYMPIRNWNHLETLLAEALTNYNELVAAMNLVMFEDAMYHVCRINRILESPRGNALLVGVGGSGKQSLSRLSSFISSLEVFQIQLRKGYSISDLKAELAVLYMKAGLKNIGITFLMTDSQVPDERFLVVVNDMLASGEVDELFADDELENIINSMKGEVKQAGMLDTKENCWKFFIDKVRKTLKVILCFSPVGNTLRRRARQFPALVNCTSINWFQDWPEEALRSVSTRFLADIKPEILPQELQTSVSLFMSYVHSVVNDISAVYLRNEKRYNYTTPKSFLEQISLYTKLITDKTDGLNAMIKRLENGLTKLLSCSGQVDELKVVLAKQEVVLKAKNDIADKILEEVRAENTKAEVEKAYVAEEEAKVAEIKESIALKQKKCDADLIKAEPAVRQAEAALETLNKNNLTELKAFASPPPAVAKVLEAVLVLFSPKGKVPKDRSWKACKAMMGGADQFLSSLKNYNKENIHPEVVKAIQPYINNKEFDPDLIATKSQAASGLCSWVLNVMVFHYINETVKPLRQALAQANSELKAAMEKLHVLQLRMKELQVVLDELGEKMDHAMGEKQKCQAEADATAMSIDLANRLVNGLASEKVRWAETVEMLNASSNRIPGDVLLVTAFISYVGCFSRKYRQDLINVYWIPFLNQLEVPIPRTEELDPLSMLTDDAQIATWNNEGLPTDRMSAENATILVNSSRWPLMIDPQLQGIKWIKNKYKDDLVVLRLTQRNYLDNLERAISGGDVVLLENIMETVDAVLDPVLGRILIRKGTAVKIGEKEVDYNPNFKLILQTKLANPHYKPEMQAQTTLINFTVTRDGLEEQLLGEVVKAERPDLEETKSELTKQQNTFKITLKTLEDNLLQRLSSAGPNVLSDVELVVNLETTKKTAADIEIKVAEAKITGASIDEARELYRPAAARASLLYFILNDLCKINMIYQFSLKAFNVVFNNAIKFATPANDLNDRLENLIDSITFVVFMYTSRGLFEVDKLTFICQMTIQILLQAGEATPWEVDFLLRYPYDPLVASPVDFLSDVTWGGIKVLSNNEDLANLEKDIQGAAKRWKAFVESEAPEKEKYPQEWKSKSPLQRLCIMRCLRLDRMSYAVRGFVAEVLGKKFVESRSPPFHKSFEETSSVTPVFFILSTGVDPLKDVEALGIQLGFTTDAHKFHNVSLGQGQEPVAEHAMDVASAEGHWVILQNIHLVKNWLSSLEKKIEQLMVNSHDDYRLFMSAEAGPDPRVCIIPQGILESAVKITNEPPTGMRANIHKSLDNFDQDTLEMCTKESEFKAILFALCYFHAVVAERRRFGPQGWNRVYPFNFGDLTISVNVLLNYLESNVKVPWEDLRYLFGEIMYGGHITDDWDRRLCRTYLVEYLQPELVDGDLFLAPGFQGPQNSDYQAYHQYIDDYIPPENPTLYGLHPNAEIGFLTVTAENLFRTVLEMQPRDTGASAGAGQSAEDIVKEIIEDIMDRLPDEFSMLEMAEKATNRTPFTIVAFQECERMNILCNELRRSLGELDLGLKGELTINAEMEELQNYLFMDVIPPSWSKKAYPSSLNLMGWFNDLLNRQSELAAWIEDFTLPSSVWLAGFFNPQSFLTAIMQQTARKNEWPLDKMCLHCEVTKKQKEDFTAPPREGAYINGLYMEGARWDISTGTIADSFLKELFPLMPVIYIKAITQDKQDLRNMYECPVYITRSRGPTYVWTFNLRSKEKPTKWTLAGVAILLQT